jgi:RNA polymerase sigma-70 factor (ECF subfamily)
MQLHTLDCIGSVPQNDHTERFEDLAMPLFRSLYNFAHWMSRDRAQAEDLVQDTYLRALKGFSSYQAGTNFRAWIFRILRNRFLTMHAQVSRAQHVSIEEEGYEGHVPTTVHTPESILMDQITHEQIRAALDRLPPDYREVILLCDVEEMRYQEIAQALEIPVGTVMSRISRGRRMLFDRLHHLRHVNA